MRLPLVEMIPRHGLVITADVALAAAAVPLAFFVRGNFTFDGIPFETIGEASLIAAVAAAVAFALVGTHRALWRYVTVRDFLPLLTGATAAVLGFVALVFLWDRLASVPRAVPVVQWLLLVVTLCGARLLYAALAAHPAPGAGDGRAARWQPVLLVGGGDGALLVTRLLAAVPEAGWRPVGILDDRLPAGRAIDHVPILGRLDEARRVLGRLTLQGLRPGRIVVTAAHDELGREAVQRLQKLAYAERLPVSNLPDLLRLYAARLEPRAEAPRPLQAAFARLERRSYPGAKRLADIALGLALLTAAAPLLVLLALAVRCGIGAPVLFPQRRGGRGGVPFVLYKFRTMRDLYDARGRPLDEARRTPWIGRILRRTRLDELPQLWNVVRGDMALVGPRPLIERELAELPDRGRARGAVRPGITGWAQVHGGQLLGLEAKHALDLWYVRHASLALDLRILLLTVRMMLLGERIDAAAVAQARTGLASA